MDSSPPPPGDDPGGGRLPPVHLRPLLWALVWVGGAAGTVVRWLISSAAPPILHVPLAIAVINIVGAFLLGTLMAALARRGPDVGRRRLLRLLLGTGFLGGFTTYSALAVDTVVLGRAGLPGHAVAYAAATIVLGGLASLAGIAVGRGPGKYAR